VAVISSCPYRRCAFSTDSGSATSFQAWRNCERFTEEGACASVVAHLRNGSSHLPHAGKSGGEIHFDSSGSDIADGSQQNVLRQPRHEISPCGQREDAPRSGAPALGNIFCCNNRNQNGEASQCNSGIVQCATFPRYLRWKARGNCFSWLISPSARLSGALGSW